MRKYRKPHRIKNKKPVYKEKYFLPAFSGFLLSALATYFFVFSNTFQVKSIEITGNQKVPQQSVLNLVENEIRKKFLFMPTKSIFLASAKEIKEHVLDDFIQVADLEMSKDFPQSLKINVIERIGLAIFCNGQCFFIDKEGIVFEETDAGAGFLKITKDSPGELNLGDRVMEKDLFSKIMQIFSFLAELDIPAKQVFIESEERINVLTYEGWEAYFDPLKDVSWQLAKLEALFKEYVPQEKRSQLEYVELRFGDLAPFKYR